MTGVLGGGAVKSQTGEQVLQVVSQAQVPTGGPRGERKVALASSMYGGSPGRGREFEVAKG